MSFHKTDSRERPWSSCRRLGSGHSLSAASFLSRGSLDSVAAPVEIDPDSERRVRDIDWEAVPKVHHSFLSFPRAIHSFAQVDPDAVCNAWLDRSCEVVKSFTRAQLWEYSGNVARMLVHEHGVQRGDRLMVVFPFGIEWIVSFLACLRIGATVVSAYPPDPARLARDVPKLAYFVQHSGSRIALTVAKYKQLVATTSLVRKWPSGIKWIATDSSFVSTVSAPSLFQFDVDVQAEEIAVLQYTSGSTGDPKGVCLTHGNLFHQSQSLQTGTFALADSADASEHHYVGWTPQYHDMGLLAVIAGLYHGAGTTYTFSPLDWLRSPTMWPKAMEKFRATSTTAPNFSYELTCKRLRERNESFDCSSVRVAWMGGEPTRRSTMEEAAKTMQIPRGALHNVFGLAEHTVMVAAFGHLALGESVGASLSFARACGIDVRIASADAEGSAELLEAREGTMGEICVQSASVASSYWQAPELSEATFGARIRGREGRYLRTGDTGCVLQEELFVVSRLKDLIIVNGRNFAPSDLETAAEHQFAADVRPGSSVAFQHAEEVILVCEVRRGRKAAVAVDSLAQSVRSAVEAECEVALAQVVLVEEKALPKTTSGKVQRALTAKLFAAGDLKMLAATRRGKASLATCGSLREMVAALGVEDMEQTLSHNGVSSLEMTELAGAAQQRLAVDLDFELLATLSAEELCLRAESEPQLKEAPLLQVFEEVDAHLPPRWLRLLRQLLVLLAALSCILLAALPSVALVEHAFDAESAWWMSNGRGGPLILAVLVLWMVSFSLVCALVKWSCVGVRKPGSFCPLWSSDFMKWMMVERLLGTWEFAVGRFLLDTPWLNLFYMLLGARVSLTARLHSFFRDCDMVSVGERAEVKGKIYGRVFSRTGVHFGTVAVGVRAALGPASVVQPFSEVLDDVVLEPCSVVPPFSSLAPAASRWHGNPCVLRAAASSDACCMAAAQLEPRMATRALFPPLLAGCIAGAAAVWNAVLPAAEMDAPLTEELLWLSTSYLLLFVLCGLSLFACAVALKWSFLSPWATDRLASTAASAFFPWLEKTVLVKWWHRAFGMRLGTRAAAVYSHLCPPSSAHMVRIGANSLAFNGSLAPRDTPSVWSWARGQTPSPWSAQVVDIEIGDGVGLYAQSRVESGAVLEDGVVCAGFSRVEAGERVSAGDTVVGNPSVMMRTSSESDAGALVLPASAAGLHVLLLLLHVAYLAGMATLGIHFAMWVGRERQGPWDAYARVPARLAFGVAWVHVMLAAEVLVAKWVLVGRARAGVSFRLGSVQGVCHLHLSALDCQMDAVLHTLSCGLFLADLYYWALGFKLLVGEAVLNSSFLASADADLVTIRPGAVIDDDAYVTAHQATLAGYQADRAFVAAGAVLHPQSGIFRGSVGERACLFPRSKPFSMDALPDRQTWIGSPARRASTSLRPPPKRLPGPNAARGTLAFAVPAHLPLIAPPLCVDFVPPPSTDDDSASTCRLPSGAAPQPQPTSAA